MSRVPPTRPLRVAVGSFTQASGQRAELERYVEAECAEELSRRRLHHLVERAAFTEVLQELKLNAASSNFERARRLGRLVGADAVLAGTTIREDPWVTINARLIETETGRDLGTGSARVFNTIKYAQLEQQLLSLSSGR